MLWFYEQPQRLAGLAALEHGLKTVSQHQAFD
jgi:hypothetical protein